jgi:hypothetical protein
MVPLKGDALYPGPIVSGVSKAKASFGLQVVYGTDTAGNPTVNLNIQGAAAANQLMAPLGPSAFAGSGLSSGVLAQLNLPQFTIGLNPPQVQCSAGTSGDLPPGIYLIAASALASSFTIDDIEFPGLPTPLGTPQAVTIPVTSPPANNGSIDVTILMPSTDPSYGITALSVQLYMGLSIGGQGKAGFYAQGAPISNSPAEASVDVTLTYFDQSQAGAPDASLDHYAVAWKRVYNAGCWDEQIQALTSDSITIAGAGMTTNQWAGHILKLIGKLDPAQELIQLNMPVASSTASTGSSPGPAEFTLTIGPNSAGDQLPDLTTLMIVGDLVSMRFNPTFGLSSFSDPNIANGFYPNGNTGNVGGNVAMVLSGPDAGDEVSIAQMQQDGDGNYTICQLAAPWAVTPNSGDIVVLAESGWGPEYHAAVNNAAPSPQSVVASPLIPNLPNQSWIAIVRAQNAASDNGLDQYAPMQDFYAFGTQGTRFLSVSATMLATDRLVVFFDLAADIVYQCLPFSQIPGQSFYFQNDDTTYSATIQCYGSGMGVLSEYQWLYKPILSVQSDIPSAITFAGGGFVALAFAGLFGSPPVGGPVVVVINVNGTPWVTLTIPAGAWISNQPLGSTLGGLSDGDVLTVDITTVGSTNPGSNLVVAIVMESLEVDTIGTAGLSSITLLPGQAVGFAVPADV